MAWYDAIPIVGPIIGAIQGNQQAQLEANVARENTDKTIAAQKEAAQRAFEQNVQMWQMQNSYNSPQAQMQRYRDAGLNPNLAVAGGNPGNASGIPNYQAPQLRYDYKAAPAFPNVMSALSDYQTFRLNQAQLQNLESTGRGIELDNALKGLNYGIMSGPAVHTDKDGNVVARYDSLAKAKAFTDWTGKLRSNELSLFQRDALFAREQYTKKAMDLLAEQIVGKQLENSWMRSGVTRNDNVFLRMGMRAVDSFFGPDWMKRYFDPYKR